MEDDGDKLKKDFLETFNFYKNVFNSQEAMLEWKKLKYDLKRYKKF